MFVKIYALIWFLGILAVAALYLTENFTPLWQLIFGFLSAVALFIGMMSVLPSTFSHHTHTKE